MPSEKNWIKQRIAEAVRRHPSVTESVSVRLEELLGDQLSTKELAKTELKSVAVQLLGAMAPSGSEDIAKT